MDELRARVRSLTAEWSGPGLLTPERVFQTLRASPKYSRMKEAALRTNVRRVMGDTTQAARAASPRASDGGNPPGSPAAVAPALAPPDRERGRKGGLKKRGRDVGDAAAVGKRRGGSRGGGRGTPTTSAVTGDNGGGSGRGGGGGDGGGRTGGRSGKGGGEAGGGPPGAIVSTTTTASPIPAVRLRDLGGIESHLDVILNQVLYPVYCPAVYRQLGVEPPHGLLLHGPAGCGKTMLAHAIVGELGDRVHYQELAAPEVVSGVSGESEKRLRQVFDAARRHAPAIIFIDEIAAIAAKRDGSQRGMEKRIVAQLLKCMDDLRVKGTEEETVIVIAATSTPDNLDPSLRRAGRFDREVCIGIPDDAARCQILRVLTAHMNLPPDFDYEAVARMTPGYVGADLAALANEAAVGCVNRVFRAMFGDAVTTGGGASGAGGGASGTGGGASGTGGGASGTGGGASAAGGGASSAGGGASGAGAGAGAGAGSSAADGTAATAGLSAPSAAVHPVWQRFTAVAASLQSGSSSVAAGTGDLLVTFEDFKAASRRVQPTATREGFATIPDVTWDDVGALTDVREEMHLCVVDAIQNPDRYKRLNVRPAAGVLLFGPPGCGKTMLAKAIANESRANFISVKGPELLDKYVGESERAVRQVFQRAQASAPCIVFFDELDALAPRRGGDGGGSGVSERVVNQLLTEMNGVGDRGDVFIVAATNRPDIIDSALLRPGRLDKLLYVPLPSEADRPDILATHLRNTPTMLSKEDIATIAKGCGRFSGADLAGLVREAAMLALREATKTPGAPEVVTMAHFKAARSKVKPSVRPEDLEHYQRLKTSIRNQHWGDEPAVAPTPVFRPAAAPTASVPPLLPVASLPPPASTPAPTQ